MDGAFAEYAVARASHVVPVPDGISSVDHTTVVSESPVALRVFPRKNISNDDLSRALSEAAFKEQWPLLELHTEEGRLDEVFRTITLPDTKASNK